LSELAICLTARHLRASYEWHAHAPLAVEAGVPAAAIEAIRTGAKPSFTATDQVLVHRVITELIDTKRLTDATFGEALARCSASKGSSNLARSSAITRRSETR
jgi:4-carboxymuconolactone decarboxylase